MSKLTIDNCYQELATILVESVDSGWEKIIMNFHVIESDDELWTKSGIRAFYQGEEKRFPFSETKTHYSKVMFDLRDLTKKDDQLWTSAYFTLLNNGNVVFFPSFEPQKSIEELLKEEYKDVLG